MTLQELLQQTDEKIAPITHEPISVHRKYRVAIQSDTEDGVHIIIHPMGQDGDTLDFRVVGNTLVPLEN